MVTLAHVEIVRKATRTGKKYTANHPPAYHLCKKFILRIFVTWNGTSFRGITFEDVSNDKIDFSVARNIGTCCKGDSHLRSDCHLHTLYG
jgi:hypothetical protein